MTHVNAFKTDLDDAVKVAHDAVNEVEAKAKALVAKLEEDLDGTPEAPTSDDTNTPAEAPEVAPETETKAS